MATIPIFMSVERKTTNSKAPQMNTDKTKDKTELRIISANRHAPFTNHESQITIHGPRPLITTHQSLITRHCLITTRGSAADPSHPSDECRGPSSRRPIPLKPPAPPSDPCNVSSPSRSLARAPPDRST